MIVSGWLELISSGRDTLSVDWTPEIGGTSILAAIVLSSYQQGFSPDFLGAAAAYVRGYTPKGGTFVPIPGDPRNNAYYIDACESVLFRLAGNLVTVYAHAAAYQLGGVGGFRLLEHTHRDFEITHGQRVVGQHRVSLLTQGSRMNVDAVLAQSNAQLAAHHGVDIRSLAMKEVHGGRAPGAAGSTRIALP